MTTDETEPESDPLAVFASPRAPGWEWQALRVERVAPPGFNPVLGFLTPATQQLTIQ